MDITFNSTALIAVLVMSSPAPATTTQMLLTNDASSPVIFSVAPSEFTDIHQLRSAYDFALVDGWDGGDALAVTPTCLSNLQSILTAVPSTSHWPEATPLVRGGLNLLWDEAGIYVFLEVRNDGAAHLYCNIRGLKWEAVRSFDDQELRSRLQDALSEISGRLFSYVRVDGQTSPIAISL
jgi:hypothetical protein